MLFSVYLWFKPSVKACLRVTVHLHLFALSLSSRDLTMSSYLEFVYEWIEARALGSVAATCRHGHMMTSGRSTVLHMHDSSAMEEYYARREGFDYLHTVYTGFSTRVFAVRCNRTHSMRAIKQINKKAAALTLERLGSSITIANEIGCLRLLDHAHVIRPLTIFDDANVVSIVMPRVARCSLIEEVLRLGAIAEDYTATHMSGICHALYYIHSRHIVHRDVKPENICILQSTHGSEIWQLTDFGLARTCLPADTCCTVCGTPFYMAPEVFDARQSPYGQPADVWSLGITIFIVLSGESPFFEGDGDVRDLSQEEIITFSSTASRFLTDASMQCVASMLLRDPRTRATTSDVVRHTWFMRYPVCR